MFDRVKVPTPFQIGPVNAYVGDSTVVDPGPNSERARETLTDALAERGQEPADVEQVLITHPHPDHFGQAAWLEDLGATVRIRPEATPICTDFAGRHEYEQSYFAPFFARNGMPAETAKTVTELPTAFLEYTRDVSEPVALTDGETVPVGESKLSARAVEGHAVGELVFEFETGGERVAIVGDHVLPNTTPNPFLQPPPEEGEPRPRVLPQYNDSLDRLAEDGFDRFLPGHGGPIESPASQIRSLREQHEERTDNVRSLVEGRVTAYEVMHGLFEDLPVIEYFPAMSESIGHLDVLERRDAVTTVETDDGILYERT